MYTINFDPVIFEVFGFGIRWYSMFYILGFLVLMWFMKKCVKLELIKGLSNDKVEDFIFYVLLGVIVGSRVGYFLFYDVVNLFSFELFKVWNGGMSFHGGMLGFVVAVMLFVRKFKVNLWELLDASTIPVIFALMLGRIGNFINGELIGTVYSGTYCVVFPLYDQLCRHAYPLYIMFAHLFVLVLLLVLFFRNMKTVGSKELSAWFLIGYGVTRFIADFYKVDNLVFGLKTGQWLCIVMVVVGIWVFRKAYKYKN
jgi:phosphatidylglycerol:prolipoprotein diacylglycerol transferase